MEAITALFFTSALSTCLFTTAVETIRLPILTTAKLLRELSSKN